MANKKVVPGSLTDAYKKRQGDFSPNLVGFQLTKGTPLFTLGNFELTTNLDPKQDTYFNTGEFSQTYTLNNLGITEQQSEFLVSNDIYTTLNLDPTDLSKFTYYGSLVEYMRVSIEGIISKWKGSLYVTDDLGGFSRTAKYTVLGYNYNELTNQSTVIVPTLFVENKFDLITNDLGGLILDETDISNIKLSYDSYEISNEYGTFPLLGYTGDTEGVDPYIRVTVQGEAFPTLTGSSFGTFNYHLKPKDSVVDFLFFDRLEEFENILLNRLTYPKYTSSYESVVETDSGSLLSTRKSFTWPTTDGFNIDVDTVEYTQYLEGILKLSGDYDRFKSNLISRRFVSNSIHEFDTDDEGSGNNSQSRKVNKLLKIYGREFDEVKKYVDSIKYANVVTYDKKNNTPDELIKNMARTLGFEAIKSVSDNSLLRYIAKSNEVIFSGQSRSMSVKEIDTELWRRLVINAWWLFKSKGHRKVIEFLVKLFGLNECLVNIDECVYVVKDKLDVEETFNKIEEVLSRDGTDVIIDRNDYPIDEQGFPRTLPNTPDYYFQMDGFWYNNGTERTIGNNPHFGPYDYGNRYFDKFRCFIDDFSGKTIVDRQEYIESVNLFPDYNNGDLEITFEDGKPLQDYGVEYADIMENTDRVSENTDVLSAGFSTIKSRTGRGSLQITFNVCDDGNCDVPCPVYRLDEITGVVIGLDSSGEAAGPLTLDCCKTYGFEYDDVVIPEIYKSGLNDDGLRIVLKYESNLKQRFGETFISENQNTCFWCRPAFPVCDFQSYMTSVYSTEGINGIINILLNEGVINQDQIEGFITQWNQNQENVIRNIKEYFNNIYEGYCLLVHEDFGQVSEQCCKIRGGEWINVLGNNDDRASQPRTNFKCVIPYEVPPPPDPCACELPEYCEYKEMEPQYMHGFSYLDCTDYYTEFDRMGNIPSDLFVNFRAQRDSFLKLQINHILGGGTYSTYYPIPSGQEAGYSTLGNYYTQNGVGYLRLPRPIPGYESYTGYQSWRLVNLPTCPGHCTDEFFGWVPSADNESGEPIIDPDSGTISGGNFVTPCEAQEVDGDPFGIADLPDGTVWVNDYEDIAGYCRQTRDAALKAKNELALSIFPFFTAAETAPNYFLKQCGYSCGEECGCVDEDCPQPVIKTYTLDEFFFLIRGITTPTYTKSLYE
jgi:hypothetical protein